jgi:hypothetical protein
MGMDRRAGCELVAARRAFNAVIVTVGSLYIATRSIDVTVAGSVIAAALSGWAMWLWRPGSDGTDISDQRDQCEEYPPEYGHDSREVHSLDRVLEEPSLCYRKGASR